MKTSSGRFKFSFDERSIEEELFSTNSSKIENIKTEKKSGGSRDVVVRKGKSGKIRRVQNPEFNMRNSRTLKEGKVHATVVLKL